MAEGDVVATSPLRKTTVRMQRSSLVLLNAVTSWAGTLIGAAITFFLVPFLIAQLGKEGYGLTGLAITVMAFAGIAQLGLGGAMSRHLAEHIAKGDTHRFNEVVSSGATVFLPMGVVLASACVIFAPELVGLLNVSAALHDQALFVVRYYTAGAVVLSFVTPVFGGVITSTGKFTAHNYIGATCSIGRGILLFAVLGLTDWGLKGWCIVCLLVEVVRLTLLRYAAYRFWPEMRIAPRFVSRGALATLFSLGGNLFVLRLTGLLGVYSDPFVLTFFLGPVAVALYQPALVVASAVRPFIGTLSEQLHPMATGLHALGNKEELRQVLIRGTRYTFLMGIGACAILGGFAYPIAEVWLSKSLGGNTAVVAQVLMVWVVVELFAYAAGSQWAVLLGMNRLKFLVLTQLPLGVVNLVVSAYLVGYTSLGIVGVVIPTALIGAIRRPVIVVYTARVCGMSGRRYFKESYLWPLVVLAIVGSAAGVLEWYVQPHALVPLALCAGAVLLVWAPAVWWIGFTRNDRESFLALARRTIDVLRLRVACQGGQSAGGGEADSGKDESGSGHVGGCGA